MTRLHTLFAIAALVAPIGAASAASYSATPAAPATATTIIGRDISWRCGADSCAGSTDTSRPVVLCQGLAKKAGRIEKFVADGRALGATELAACNAFAKPLGNSAAVASAQAR